MSMGAEKISAAAGKMWQSAASIAKILLQSKWRCHLPDCSSDSTGIVVLGNGPSLKQTIANESEFLRKHKLMAVNFSLNAPEMRAFKPEFYVLADGHFFTGTANDNVRQLWENINSVNWHMTLFIPTKVNMSGIKLNNPYITVVRYNLTPVEGADCVSHAAYRRGLGMPRPRNVLIPSLMLAIGMKFHTIYIAGADHSWPHDVWVDDANHVIMGDVAHFYKEDSKEQQRISTEYVKYPLHQIIFSWYVAFRSYHDIRRYADTLVPAVKIYNITPKSFIDAFERLQVATRQ